MMNIQQRQALIDKVEWLADDSGLGFGIPAVGNAMVWGMDRPRRGQPDLKSTVFLNGSPDNYSDEELELTVAFALRHTANHDRMYKFRRGCNAIVFGKTEDRWLRKRMSWQYGPMFSSNLPEAMGKFDHDLNEYIPDKTCTKTYGLRMGTIPLKHVLLAATIEMPSEVLWQGDETIVEVVRKYEGKFKEPSYLHLVGITDDGEEIAFNNSRMIVLAETREKLHRLLEIRAQRPGPQG